MWRPGKPCAYLLFMYISAGRRKVGFPCKFLAEASTSLNYSDSSEAAVRQIMQLLQINEAREVITAESPACLWIETALKAHKQSKHKRRMKQTSASYQRLCVLYDWAYSTKKVLPRVYLNMFSSASLFMKQFRKHNHFPIYPRIKALRNGT